MLSWKNYSIIIKKLLVNVWVVAGLGYHNVAVNVLDVSRRIYTRMEIPIMYIVIYSY